MAERESTNSGAVVLLDGPNGMFGLRDIFFGGSNVKVDSSKFQERVTEAGELFISVGDCKVETTSAIEILNPFHAREDVRKDVLAGDVFNSDEM